MLWWIFLICGPLCLICNTSVHRLNFLLLFSLPCLSLSLSTHFGSWVQNLHGKWVAAVQTEINLQFLYKHAQHECIPISKLSLFVLPFLHQTYSLSSVLAQVEHFPYSAHTSSQFKSILRSQDGSPLDEQNEHYRRCFGNGHVQPIRL